MRRKVLVMILRSLNNGRLRLHDFHYIFDVIMELFERKLIKHRQIKAGKKQAGRNTRDKYERIYFKYIFIINF